MFASPPAPRRLSAFVLIALIGLCWTASVVAAPAVERFDGVSRVVVFGDVHGAFDAMVELLRGARVIDQDNHWIAGDAHLVSLGDLLDRGPDSRQAMDLLMALSEEAAAAGGRVHVVMGNHELMNLTGDLRYVSAAGYQAFAADETPELRAAGLDRLLSFEAAASAAAAESADAAGTAPENGSEPAVTLESLDAKYPRGYFARRAAFAPTGRYGAWILTLPAMVIVNDSAFVHGGFPGWLTEYGYPEIVQRVRDSVGRVLSAGAELVDAGAVPPYADVLDPSLAVPPDSTLADLRGGKLLGDDGPLWYRGTAYCHPLIEESTVAAWLEHLGVKRLVVGHSPTTTRRVEARFDGSVVLADTGMLTSYYHGEPAAVILEGDGLRVLYPREAETVTVLPVPPAEVRMRLTGEGFERFMAGLDAAGGEDVVFANLRFKPVFRPGDKREVASRVAAYRLDRLLGLGLVPPTEARTAAGEPGTLALLPVSTITEAERAADNIYRPTWCEPISDYQLMYAFDGLIRNEARTAGSILYDRNNWALVLLLEGEAFGTSASLPAYLEKVSNVLPRGLAERLAALDVETLTRVLGDVLSERQIRAIDRRRQALLDGWQVAG